MSCTRASAVGTLFFVALLVSLLSPRLPIAYARHVGVRKTNDGLNNIGGDMYLAMELTSASPGESAMKRGFSARELGARNKEEAAQAMDSRPRTVELRAAAKHGDAANEMYDMLRRDYAWKARRRRPINNGAEPLQEKGP